MNANLKIKIRPDTSKIQYYYLKAIENLSEECQEGFFELLKIINFHYK